MAKASSLSEAARYPLVGVTNLRGVLREPCPQLKKRVELTTEIKFGSWNVGTMTRKSRELVEVFKKGVLKLFVFKKQSGLEIAHVK